MIDQLADKLAKALFDYAVAWLADPAHRDEVDAALAYAIDKVTDATPWAWDDAVLDAFAVKIGNRIPDMHTMSADIVNQLISRISMLGGRL